MSSSLSNRCQAEIDLSALEQNVREIRKKLPQNLSFISVVKADAYGHGAAPLLSTLRAAGADIFAVASAAEGIELRKHDPKTPILLLSATLTEEDPAVFEHKLTPMISSSEEIFRFQKLAEKFERRLPIHLMIDTGMGRLGIRHPIAEQLFSAAKKADKLEINGICSHFSSAGTDPEFTQLQRKRLRTVFGKYAPKTDPLLFHIDNSAGISDFDPSAGFNAIRIGLLQYGIHPVSTPEMLRFDVEPVLSFHSRASIIKSLPKGETVSYSRTRKLSRNSRIAVVPAGYADAVLRSLSSRGEVLLRGKRCPFLGQVTMDNIMIDVTDVPNASTGDLVTIIGRQENEEVTAA